MEGGMTGKGRQARRSLAVEQEMSHRCSRVKVILFKEFRGGSYADASGPGILFRFMYMTEMCSE